MSNGGSVLHELASALFVYAVPEIEQSKVLFEELCRSADGNDMQAKYDQMLLFEKLREGLFDDMIWIGLCMHAMVRWKSDEQQRPLTVERQKVSVYLEQERLFQEQLKDVMEQRKWQQAKLELYDK
jgi:hypothetical protein